jgi:hypothetical protein
MKKFKEFESMVTDDDRDSSSIDFLPKHNPVVQQNAKSYVDQIIQGNDLKLLYRAAGEEPPKNIDSMNMDDIYDELKQKAIDYFIENPEAIGKDIPMKKYKVNGGDGISRTNNLGGALHANSPRVGESKTEITISPDEMLYFNTEEPLIELIRNGKIELGNGVVHYDTSDQETKNILDIYLEIDGSTTLEESLEYLKYTDRKKSSLINLGNCGNINEGRYQVLTLNIVNEDYKTKVNLVKSVSDWMIASIVDIKKSIKDKNGKVTEWVDHLEGQRNLTFICENKFENSGLKEFFKKIWESL